MTDQIERRLRMYPMTPFKRGLLSVLYGRGPRQTWAIGAHPSHRTRALRELREMGCVTYSRTRDAWSITREGKAIVEADRVVNDG